MSRIENVGQQILRSKLSDYAAKLKRLSEEDPAAYQAIIDDAHARNPRGGRK